MAHLYEIENELQQIFNLLEENGGEFTEEIEQALEITQQNLNDKIEAYCHIITMYDSEIDCCKNEKDRINSIQKVKKNAVDRIKFKLLEAVNKFGVPGKTGNKRIDLPTHKLYTIVKDSVSPDQSRIGKLSYYFQSYMKELQSQGLLELGENIDVNGFLDCVNAIIKSEYETPDDLGNTPVEEFVPYTIADLQAVTLHIDAGVSLYNLITSESKLGYLLAANNVTNVVTDCDKDVAKAILKDDNSRLTIATLEKKDSLTIK